MATPRHSVQHSAQSHGMPGLPQMPVLPQSIPHHQSHYMVYGSPMAMSPPVPMHNQHQLGNPRKRQRSDELDSMGPPATPTMTGTAFRFSPSLSSMPLMPTNSHTQLASPRKRQRSDELESMDLPSTPAMNDSTFQFSAPTSSMTSMMSSSIQQNMPARPKAKKSRINIPWTPAEEQRLKRLRDAGNSWSDIAKEFTARTEGSVKKHWYKDMHYAEFAEDEHTALLAAIKDYEASKWKIIGQKVGKPPKACEAYAKEHWPTKV